MFIDCTNCHTHVDAEKGGELQYWASEGHRPGRFMLLRCPRCRSPLLVEQENTGDMAAGDVWDSASVVLYPQPDLRVNPKAPPEIRAAAEEGIKCYRARAYTAAAIMCRKTLEGVCEAHGVKERTLAISLKKMLETDLIDKRLFEWSDQLRLTGNEAAHGVGIVSSAQDARDGLDFTIGIIDYLFSYRDQFEKFKQRRTKGNAA
jgi:uncharacterized protein YbaR (Trm112 family)